MKQALIFILCLFSLTAAACPFEAESRFHEFSLSSRSEVKEEDFNFIVAAIKKVYIPKFKAQNENFDVVANWKSPNMNASAELDGEGRLIILNGGLASLKRMTFDVFLLIACHEVGHHLGGAPFGPVTNSTRSWMSSAEGQADYFATLKCYKDVLRTYPEVLKRPIKMDLPEETYDLCKQQYSNDQDYQICLRGSQAALDYGRIYALMNYSKQKINISLTHTMPGIEETDIYHPQPQCRTETLYQGILCNKDINIPLSFTDENQGVCSSQNSDKIGLRPKCWYVSQ